MGHTKSDNYQEVRTAGNQSSRSSVQVAKTMNMIRETKVVEFESKVV
ncbi:hypothetical protein HMPREF0083_05556 [Aneurinibacillus aneurinilyticus ATCC 12856]|uniref:Uncharacterized protein n=1 Tax=Aneurinibacillus aneurinilyticus ATCC 12856 TaxID=649747 RepID=U1WB07_ANEAE|nr:hypothetical protein HMPREF0083_05556 [Aneurinibacillus aneurinilyticus ATCC 12856]